ncbi:MAG TPA: GNAT family protein [Gemmatimonadales bacterium]|nr:GNAT family protein [Gemmatimonadales bacterium]
MDPLTLDDRTRLRPLAPADAGEVHDLITRNRAHLDQWLRWSSSIQSRADADALIAQFEEKQARGDGFHLGIWVDGRLAGGCVCWSIHRQNRNAEIGYWLGADRTGRGLATRSAAAAIDHLIGGERLHRIEMQCAVDNRASRAIPERLGFRLEGIRRDSHWITHRFLDHAVYGLLAPEWRPPASR